MKFSMLSDGSFSNFIIAIHNGQLPTAFSRNQNGQCCFFPCPYSSIELLLKFAVGIDGYVGSKIGHRNKNYT